MWILAAIEAAGGEIGFRRFMEQALYHPEHGYYARNPSPWGRHGDYLTAPTASTWYGDVCGRIIGRAGRALGRSLELVDLAAGDGSFLDAVLRSPDVEGALRRAVAVDRSSRRLEQIASRLADATVPVEAAEAVPPLVGSTVVHASELYDAMPVHRVRQDAGGLVEMTVRVEEGGLGWGSRPAGPEISDYFREHGVELETGQIAEVNLAAEPFHRELLETMEEGLALVLDYGYPAARLFDPRGRGRGSLATFHRHELGSDPLDSPGERDLTAHVNFDDLRRAASSAGWFEIGLLPLAELLIRGGLAELVEERGLGMEAEIDADTYTARQEIKRLLDPEGMGSDLKMLVQGKGRLGEIAAEILMRDI